MKNILVILGHPKKDSFCSALAQSYVDGATKSGATVNILRLYQMKFDPILHHGYHDKQPLEPDLVLAQKRIQDADHLVWVYPNWWATVPALMKGFIDRVLLPGFAFAYNPDKLIPEKLLKGKTARLIATSDSPGLYYHLLTKAPGYNMMKKGVLEFSGVRPVKSTGFYSVKQSSPQTKEKWIQQVYQLGEQFK